MMFDDILERSKRVLTLISFLAVAAWLAWCGNVYDDRHSSVLPAIMCCVTAIVFVFTGAAIVLKGSEAEME